MFVARLCKRVTTTTAFHHINTPQWPLNPPAHTRTHTRPHTEQSRMISVTFCQCFLSSGHPGTQPNPTGQRVRQRSEDTFLTWLSNRAARGSVGVRARPSSCSTSQHQAVDGVRETNAFSLNSLNGIHRISNAFVLPRLGRGGTRALFVLTNQSKRKPFTQI